MPSKIKDWYTKLCQSVWALWTICTSYILAKAHNLRAWAGGVRDRVEWYFWKRKKKEEAQDRLFGMIGFPEREPTSPYEEQAAKNAKERVDDTVNRVAKESPLGTAQPQQDPDLFNEEVPIVSATWATSKKEEERDKDRKRRASHLTHVVTLPSQKKGKEVIPVTRDDAHLMSLAGHVEDEIVPPPQRSQIKHVDTKVRGNWEKNPNADPDIQKATRFPIVDRQITRTVDHLTTSRPKISGPEKQVEIIRKWFEVDMEVASGHQKGLNRFVEDLADQMQRFGSACVFKQRTRSSLAEPFKDPMTGANRLPVQGYAIPDMATVQAFIDESGNPKKWRQDPHLFTRRGNPKEYRARDVFVPRLPSRSSAAYFWTPSVVMPVLYAVEILRDLHEAIESHTSNIVDIPTYFQVGSQKYNNGQVTATMLDAVSNQIQKTPRGHMLIIPWHVEPNKFESEEYVDELTEAATFWERIVRRGVGGTQLDDGEGSTANRATADVLDERGMRSAQALVPEIQRTARWLFLDKLLEKGVSMDEIMSHEEMATIVFEDIDISKQMSRESHTVFKWQNDAMTHAQLCRELGYPPDPERADMYYSEIQAEMQAEVDAQKAEAQARVRPGGKPKPKRKQDSRAHSNPIV